MVQRLPVKEDSTGSSPVKAEYSPIVKLVSRKNLAFAFYVRVVVGEKFKEYKQQTKKNTEGTTGRRFNSFLLAIMQEVAQFG